MGDGLDAGVKKQINHAISDLKKAGVDVVEVSLPSLPLALAEIGRASCRERVLVAV